MEDVMLTLSSELLMTVVARAASLKTTPEEETKWLPVAVMTKLGGSCEKTMVAGEIDLRLGMGRALPQRGFSALHPGRSKSTTSQELRKTIRQEGRLYPSSSNSTNSHRVRILVAVNSREWDQQSGELTIP